MRYKAVIFDLDGTLLDTIADIADSLNAVLKAYGYKTFSVEDYKYFVGRGVNELIEQVMTKDYIPKEFFPQIKKRYYEEYNIRSSIKTKPYDGIMDLLKELNKKSVPICILSNKPHSQTMKVVDYYFGPIDFAYVYGKKAEFPIKPSPDSALDIIRRLELDKSDILYVGDTGTDMLTASNAGLDSVGVLWGFRKRKELEEGHAKYIVSHPKDIYQIVTGDTNDFEQR
jgi:phosphoglycolate phosphatase